MADYKISGERLTSIANAIRGKTGKEDSLTLEQMVTEIEGIEAVAHDRALCIPLAETLG